MTDNGKSWSRRPKYQAVPADEWAAIKASVLPLGQTVPVRLRAGEVLFHPTSHRPLWSIKGYVVRTISGERDGVAGWYQWAEPKS